MHTVFYPNKQKIHKSQQGHIQDLTLGGGQGRLQGGRGVPPPQSDLEGKAPLKIFSGPSLLKMI